MNRLQIKRIPNQKDTSDENFIGEIKVYLVIEFGTDA